MFGWFLFCSFRCWLIKLNLNVILINFKLWICMCRAHGCIFLLNFCFNMLKVDFLSLRHWLNAWFFWYYTYLKCLDNFTLLCFNILRRRLKIIIFSIFAFCNNIHLSILINSSKWPFFRHNWTSFLIVSTLSYFSQRSISIQISIRVKQSLRLILLSLLLFLLYAFLVSLFFSFLLSLRLEFLLLLFG